LADSQQQILKSLNCLLMRDDQATSCQPPRRKSQHVSTTNERGTHRQPATHVAAFCFFMLLLASNDDDDDASLMML
jgi:hypothetical protein